MLVYKYTAHRTQVVRSFVKFQFSRIAISGEWSRRWPSNVYAIEAYSYMHYFDVAKVARVLEKQARESIPKKEKSFDLSPCTRAQNKWCRAREERFLRRAKIERKEENEEIDDSTK